MVEPAKRCQLERIVCIQGKQSFRLGNEKTKKRTFLATISSSFTMNSKQVAPSTVTAHNKKLCLLPVTETDLSAAVLLALRFLIRSEACLTRSSAVSLKQQDRKDFAFKHPEQTMPRVCLRVQVSGRLHLCLQRMSQKENRATTTSVNACYPQSGQLFF